MNWFFFALIGAILLSATALLQRVLMKEKSSDPYTHSVVFQLITAAVLFLFSLMTTGFDVQAISDVFPNILLMSFLYAAANIALYTSYKLTDAADVQILLATSSIWSTIGAMLFLNESLTWLRFAGILAVIVGSMIISWEKGTIKVTKGFIFGLATSLLFGFAFVNDAYLVKSFNVPSFSTIAFLLPGLLLLCIKPTSLKSLSFYAHPKRLIRLIAVAAIYGTAGMTMWYAYKSGGNVNQIAPIGQSSIVLTVLFGYFFLKEKTNTKQKLLGAAMAFIGILLVK